MNEELEKQVNEAMENEFDGQDVFDIVQELLGLREQNIKLQELWVTVNLADPPNDCNDPVVLKRYLKGCVAKAKEYELSLKE